MPNDDIRDILSPHLKGWAYDVRPGAVLVRDRGSVGLVRRLLDEAGRRDVAVRRGRDHPSGAGLADPRPRSCARRAAGRPPDVGSDSEAAQALYDACQRMLDAWTLVSEGEHPREVRDAIRGIRDATALVRRWRSRPPERQLPLGAVPPGGS